MLSHHTWSPRAPLINVVAQCMPASEPKWLFFWRPFEAKRCNNIELGERGHASFFAMSLTGWLFFWRTRTQSGKDFLVYGTDVQTQAWTNYLLHLPQPQSKHTHLQSCYPANEEAQDFLGLWLCKRKLEQIPFCTCHNPNPKTRSPSQLLPTNKECASTPPEAELHKLCFAQCTHSARYSARHNARPQNAVNTMGLAFVDKLQKTLKIFSFFVFLIIFGKIRGIYSVLWPCTVTCTVACTVRALYVHCAKHDVCAPLYFHQQNAAILLLEACRHILH